MNAATRNFTASSFKVLPLSGAEAVIIPITFTPASGRAQRQNRGFHPLNWLLSLLLLCGAGAVWFLFTAKSVIVTTTPQAELTTIQGDSLLAAVFEIKDHYVMRQGAYVFTATLAGYYPLEATIEVDSQQNQVKTFEFNKLPGLLHVTVTDQSDPTLSVDASVSIDGEQIGSSGVTLSDIAAGTHNITVQSPRYFSYTDSIEIDGKEQLQTLAVSLKPAWATIRLQSKPSGAQLYSGETLVGVTPLEGTLDQGEHQLTLALDGYQTWQQPLVVTAGVAVELPEVVLLKANGLLKLNSNPTLVGVTVDGKYRGVTPLALALSPNQSHTLLFFKEGYEQQQQQLSVRSGKDSQLDITLKPQLGELIIHADQADALLYVDDILMGRADQTLTLTIKQHNILIKKAGYLDYHTTAMPLASVQQVIDARLKTLEQVKWENIKPLIQTAAGARLKLFKPNVEFTMGASRREQGRRANEISRRVALTRPFYLGLTEITNSQFRQFDKLHSSSHVKGNSLDGNEQPVVNISWLQAVQFCNWLSEQEKLAPFYQIADNKLIGIDPQSTGYRLPTEAEWAWSSRYQEGQMLKYSWGKSLPPTANSGNFADRSGAAILGQIQASYNDKFPVSAPVASFAPNKKGLYDLAGNASEWTHDFYEVKSDMSLKLNSDPLGSATGDYHVIRGSSWAHGSMIELRLSYRDYGNDARNDVGFRVARFVDQVAGDK